LEIVTVFSHSVICVRPLNLIFTFLTRCGAYCIISEKAMASMLQIYASGVWHPLTNTKVKLGGWNNNSQDLKMK